MLFVSFQTFKYTKACEKRQKRVGKPERGDERRTKERYEESNEKMIRLRGRDKMERGRERQSK